MELKDLKKGSKVIMSSFTKTDLAVCEVIEVKEKTLAVLKKNGEKAVFSKKTGKQLNMAEGKEKYANSIRPDDGSYAPMRPSEKPKKKSSSGKAPKKKIEEPEKDDFEDDEEEEEVAPPKKKRPAKKSKLVEVEEDAEEAEEEPKPKKKPSKKKKVVSDDEE